MKKKNFLLTVIVSALSLSLISCNLFNKSKEDDTTTNASATAFNYQYTGIKTQSDPNSKTPFMAIVENSKNARPQSGLSYADIVYETSAEGGIPRFICVFHSNYPEKIGPIRSARPYFVTLANEFSLPFAHCGGSKEALSKISNDSATMSINEMYNSKYFYRDNSRVAPHNLYTSSEKVLEALKDKSFNPAPKDFLNYDDSSFNDENLKASNTIDIKCNNLYSTSYKFKDGRYEKYMDGTLSYDALTKKPLAFDNVIVQKTNITLQNDGSHLDVDLISNGTGYVFSKGKVKEIKWKKDAEYGQTKLLDLEGKEISIPSGTTIWNIIDNNAPIKF
ncbi:MAG: DUF3048 domain-containing protein [Clostridium chrysemydis]|uniref:DUF3048 domain-containing protein n=1 Tax=Clostridium chrysemydis TaxID=2665504 RepID=UPI003F2DC732